MNEGVNYVQFYISVRRVVKIPKGNKVHKGKIQIERKRYTVKEQKHEEKHAMALISSAPSKVLAGSTRPLRKKRMALPHCKKQWLPM